MRRRPPSSAHTLVVQPVHRRWASVLQGISAHAIVTNASSDNRTCRIHTLKCFSTYDHFFPNARGCNVDDATSRRGRNSLASSSEIEVHSTPAMFLVRPLELLMKSCSFERGAGSSRCTRPVAWVERLHVQKVPDPVVAWTEDAQRCRHSVHHHWLMLLRRWMPAC